MKNFKFFLVIFSQVFLALGLCLIAAIVTDYLFSGTTNIQQACIIAGGYACFFYLDYKLH